MIDRAKARADAMAPDAYGRGYRAAVRDILADLAAKPPKPIRIAHPLPIDVFSANPDQKKMFDPTEYAEFVRLSNAWYKADGSERATLMLLLNQKNDAMMARLKKEP